MRSPRGIAFRLLVTAIAAAGPSASFGADQPARGQQATASVDDVAPWIKRVRAQAVDASVLLVREPGGTISARTADGKVSVSLVTNAPEQVVLDASSEVVWARTENELSVIDLRDSTPKLIPIVTNMPTGVPWGVDGRSYVSFRDGAGCEREEFIDVDWSESPKLRIEGSIPRPKLVGRKWLASHLSRSQNEALPHIDVMRNIEPPAVSVPASARKCPRFEHVCGQSLPFGRRGWRLVLTRREDRGRCHVAGCLVTDPAQKKFATTTDLGTWFPADKAPLAAEGSCGPILFNASGTSYLVGDRLCSMDGKCSSQPGRGLGWLDPGPSIAF